MDLIQYALISQYYTKRDIYQPAPKTNWVFIPFLIRIVKRLIPNRTKTESVIINKLECKKPVLNRG